MKSTPLLAGSSATFVLLAFMAMAILLTGCGGPKSARGFRLPEGNAEKGKAAFVKLQCNSCHIVEGLPLPPPGSKSPITVVLGGEVLRVRTYGDLVTSLINPSHVISEKYKKELEGKLSPMGDFSETMTVAQMIDLVAFLQPHYKQLQNEYSMTVP